MLHQSSITAVESVPEKKLADVFLSAEDPVSAPANYQRLLASLAEYYEPEHDALINWVHTGQAPVDQGIINHLKRNRWLDDAGTRPRNEVYAALGIDMPDKTIDAPGVRAA